jgi:hypothetical protein
MEVAMTCTALGATKGAMLSVVAVLLASSLMSAPASAQATYEKDYKGELAILLLSGPSPKGLTANGAPEPSKNRQFTRMIVKKLDKVRR